MLNPNMSKNSRPDRSATMENDPFASIVKCCRVTHSAEETLGTCGFAGEDDSEELTQPEVDPIMMFTLPDTQSQPEANAGTAAQPLTPISSGAGQNVACTTSRGDKAADSGKGKDASDPIDLEMEIPEVVDSSTDSETENYQFVKKRDAASYPNRSKLPSTIRGSGEVQNVQESVIGDDQRPSKMAKSDSLNVLKEIAEHQKSSSAKNVQDSAIGDDQQPSKMAKSDSLNVLKVIAEHRKSSSAQNVQDSAIGNAQRPSKMAKFDVLNVLKQISEHQKISSSIPSRNGSLTFPRPKWWPEDYEDIV